MRNIIIKKKKKRKKTDGPQLAYITSLDNVIFT